MRIGIIADVHANMAHLRAVFRNNHPGSLPINEWWFLGDAVGYHVEVIGALELLRDNVPIERWLPGNHDGYLLDVIRKDHLNEPARLSIEDHYQRLENEAPLLLKLLEQTMEKGFRAIPFNIPGASIFFTHGSIPLDQRYPLDGEYITDWLKYLYPFPILGEFPGKDALSRLTVNSNEKPVVLIHGHTHVPYAFGIRRGQLQVERLPICYCGEHPIRLEEFSKLIICPGSVGQPRNPDPRPHAAYGILDTEHLEFYFAKAFDEAGSEQARTDMWTRYAHQMDSTRFNMDLYLTGAYPGHEFFTENPLWEYWTSIYRSTDCGWEPLSLYI